MKLRSLEIPQPSQVDYLLTMALIALSGNMALVNNDRRDLAFLFFAMFGVLRMVVLKRNPTQRMMLVYLAFMVLFALQSAALHFFAPVTIIGFFTKLTVAATIALTVVNFRLAFVRCMIWVTKLSLVFHIPVVDPPPLKWSARIVRKRRIKYGNQTTQARRDCHEVAAG